MRTARIFIGTGGPKASARVVRGVIRAASARSTTRLRRVPRNTIDTIDSVHSKQAAMCRDDPCANRLLRSQ